MPRLGHPLIRFDSIDTTMLEAARRAAAGAAEGTVVLADHQTQGRGRLGRSWLSEPGLGLQFSVILRPPTPPADSIPLTLACGLGVARGVGETCGVKCDIRWPNDVLLSGKKCCGILVELATDSGRTDFVIVGVGLNVNQEVMAPELEDIATSLRIETGCEWARDLLLEAVLRRVEHYYEMFLEQGSAAVSEAFASASSYAKGKRVVVEDLPEPIRGVTVGLDPTGVLRIRTDSGAVVPVIAGGVRPLEGEL